jgi:hypothetical protein
MRFYLLMLSVMCVGCGGPPIPLPQGSQTNVEVPNPIPVAAPTPTPSVSPSPVVISVFNAGVQDSSLGSQYVVKGSTTVTIPSSLIRTAGQTEEDGIGVGVDFGGLYQCYYAVTTAIPALFTLSQCTGDLVAGSTLQLNADEVVTLWSYAHVNSSDSVVELTLIGESYEAL